MSLTDFAAAAVKLALLPPAGPLLLYVLGLLLRRRRPRTGKWLRHGAVALLYLLSSGLGSWLLVRPLERLEAPLQLASAMASIAPPQAIVVLSASRIRRSPDNAMRPVPDFIALERINYAALLARRSGLPLLVSGGLLSSRADDEALAIGMRRVLENNYGLAVRWSEGTSRTTAENAVFSARMLRADGVSRILLVTDAMHMHRARLAFERAGLQVTAAPTMYLETGGLAVDRLIPNSENLRRSHYALYEWLGLVLYRLHPGRD